MTKIAYLEKAFQGSSLDIIEKANRIIVDYSEQGLILTLRQLYYRFVASGWIPNSQKSYSRLGSIVNDGRLAGLIDWEAIEDRGRNLNKPSTWDSPSDIINTASRSYAIDLWEGQKNRVEVWVEKQALEAVVENACQPWACPSFACKGYTSQSEMWGASGRFKEYRRRGQRPVIIHLGDHDPSGIDMTRDIEDRLRMFRIEVEVNRIALNMDQVEKFDPPPNPAKLTDSRAQGYIERFGDDSWELDALEPKFLNELIQDTIAGYVNMDKFEARRERQEREREELKAVAQNWDEVVLAFPPDEEPEDEDGSEG